jgi:hypothetical protein
MTRQRAGAGAEYLRVVVVVAAGMLALCIIACSAILIWNEFWHVPKLVYTVLPTYVVKEQSVNGLVVENRGRQAAHQVLIRVANLDEPIQTFTIKTGELITAKEGDERNIIVRLERIVPGSAVTIYLPTEQPVSLEKYLTVTAEEGAAVPASSQETLNTALALGLVAAVAVLLLIIGGSVGWVLARGSRA